MFKTLRLPLISRPLSWILIWSLLSMTSGCYYFKVTRSAEPPRDVITKMKDENKFIILHLDDQAWQFRDITVNEDFITGIKSFLSGHERYKTVKAESANRYVKKIEASSVLNEVHIYVTGFMETADGRISIPTKDIQKIEIYDKDQGATAASWIFSSVGIGIGAFAVLLVIVALTKSSCPFVYTSDGTGLSFSGEIFSGATQPGLERDDYLPLKEIESGDGSYILKLTNEVHEIQSVNVAQLICVDHPDDLSVLIDKYGTVNTFHKPSPPVSARNGAGLDILPVIVTKDTLNYSGDEKNIGKNGIEDIVMEFVRPHNCDSAKLIIRAKNSFWLDVLFTKFHKLFGERYNIFTAKQESLPGEKLNKFLLDQKIPLSVYIEREGKWQYADYFNIAGPMALRDDILPLNLAGISSDTIKLKLETGFLFWEVDYAGMDFSRNETCIPELVSANSALDKTGTDVRALVDSKDNNYMVLRDVGDELTIDFDKPALKNTKRTLFLHTSGYYKILREQKGPADKKALKTFRKPNRFPEFSKETYDLLPVDSK
jgi:hypothetical protein